MSNDPDAHAFAAACEAALGIHPDRVRKIVDAYTGELRIRVREIHEGTPLTPEQTLELLKPRDVEF